MAKLTQRDVLEFAINKAMVVGYRPDGIENVSSIKPTIRNGQAWVRWFNNDGQEVIQDLEHVIYSKDFAKALWGKLKPHPLAFTPVWKAHLQQMVIAPDPIEYLREHM